MSRLNLNLPFVYTYNTRINTNRGLLAYLILEVLPLILAAGLTSVRNIVNVLLLYILWLDLYEIGYLFNDHKDQTAVGELDRIGPTSDSWYLAVFTRLLLALGLLPVVVIQLGWRGALTALITNALLLLVLCLHSSDFVRRHFPGRIVTFSALALYKYAPILFPVLEVRRAEAALLAIFLFYGVARVFTYVLRKFAGKEAGFAPSSQLKIQLGLLAVFFPLVLTVALSNHDMVRRDVPLLWLYFSAVSILFYAAPSVQRWFRR